ncbi:hypothetical protein TCAL_02965 [Tigriopus californicus]|uniref:Uncharacterized protein n=1 Tax=Tigriopus californicus TaxID=6832 RepID=A0A553PTG5_TIGCA|nr:leukocyte surface antigen CD53-like [Tigriopus californicus]TRY80973.1 hypothetical protein TCAL_02965 [Tigriopus californicus]
MAKCCLDLAKFLLFLVNLAAWVLFGTLLAGGVFLLVESESILGFPIQADVSADNPSALYFMLLLIGLVVCAFFFVFTFLGCCGAACQNRCMLGSFIIILFVFLGANVGAILFMYSHFPSEVAMVTAELQKTIPYYDPVAHQSMVRAFWDAVQPMLACCGAESFRDWASVRGLKPGRKVPASCCWPSEVSDCVYQPEPNNAYMAGCVSQVHGPLVVLFWAIPVCLALMVSLALCVCLHGDRRTSTRHASGASSNGRGMRRRRNKRSDSRQSQYSEETGYIYRAHDSAYPSAPPYNPQFRDHEALQHSADSYPTGLIPPEPHEYTKPLIQPPAYHEVMARRNQF